LQKSVELPSRPKSVNVKSVLKKSILEDLTRICLQHVDVWRCCRQVDVCL